MDFVSQLRFRVRLTHDGDGLWYADCLDLDGCHTFGKTKEEALENIHEVLGDRILAGVDDARRRTADRYSRRAGHWSERSTTETIEIKAA